LNQLGPEIKGPVSIERENQAALSFLCRHCCTLLKEQVIRRFSLYPAPDPYDSVSLQVKLKKERDIWAKKVFNGRLC